MNRKKLIDLVNKIVNAEGGEKTINNNIKILEKKFPYCDVSDLIFYPPENEDYMVEEIVDILLLYEDEYFRLLRNILIAPNNIYSIYDYRKWNEIEQQLDMTLPFDYKNFITTYGIGGINNFIFFLTPFSEDDNINYFKKMNEILSSYKISKNNFPNYFIHGIYPEENGLLPIGYTENGDEIFYIVNKNKSFWDIVVYESRSPDFHIYSMKLTEFIYKLIIKEITCDAFPNDVF